MNAVACVFINAPGGQEEGQALLSWRNCARGASSIHAAAPHAGGSVGGKRSPKHCVLGVTAFVLC
eukprot:4555937-Amphidinium_carterae.1